MSQSKIISLTANTAASVTFTAPESYSVAVDNIYVAETYTIDRGIQMVEVVNRDGGGEVWYTINGATPTVAGNNLSYLPELVGASNSKRIGAASTVTVRLISDSNVLVYVEAI